MMLLDGGAAAHRTTAALRAGDTAVGTGNLMGRMKASRQALTPSYRGPDRRAAPTARPVGDAAVVVAALLLCTLGVLFSVLASQDAQPDNIDLQHLNGLLAAACAVFAIGAGYVSAL